MSELTSAAILGAGSLGTALAKRGQIDEAIRQFQEAVRLKPNDADARSNLGNALDKNGQTTRQRVQLGQDGQPQRYELGYDAQTGRFDVAGDEMGPGSLLLNTAVTVSGANFEVLIGFEVTPSMAAFNREGKRFRPNAGQVKAPEAKSGAAAQP